MKFTVIVCTYNGADTIEECLRSLLAQDFSEDYEIIVVDDGSTDETDTVVERFTDDGVQLIRHQTNKGLAAARNTGWKAAEGTYVAYIDDDAVAPPDWLSSLHARYDEHIDGVGGYPESYYNDVIGDFEVARGLYRYGPDAENIDGPGGMNMSFRRSVLEDLGGFDENFVHIGDDADIGKRIQKQGINYVVDPNITVEHKFPQTLWEYCRKNFHRGKGAKQLSEKHDDQPPFARYVLLAVLYPILIPHAVYEGTQVQRYAERGSLIEFVGLTYLLRICNYWGIVYYWLRNEQ